MKFLNFFKGLFESQPASSSQSTLTPPSTAGQTRSASLGLFNLLGSAAHQAVAQDSTMLAPVFRNKVLIGHGQNPKFKGEIPECNILMLYGHIDSSLVLSGGGSSYTLPELAKASAAQLIVVASDTPVQTLTDPKFVRSLSGWSGPAPVVIVTLDRKGDGFLKFFLQYFLRLVMGSSVTQGWVDLAPQGPNFDHWGPAAICFMLQPSGAATKIETVPNLTPFTELLRQEIRGLSDDQIAVLANSPVDGVEGGKTSQQLFDETMSKAASIPGAAKIFY
jgi:hypothetical protein